MHTLSSGTLAFFLGYHVPGPLTKSLVSTLETIRGGMTLGHLGQFNKFFVIQQILCDSTPHKDLLITY